MPIEFSSFPSMLVAFTVMIAFIFAAWSVLGLTQFLIIRKLAR